MSSSKLFEHFWEYFLTFAVVLWTVWFSAGHSENFTSDRWIQHQLARPQNWWEWGTLNLPLKWLLLRQLYLQIVNGHGQDSVGSLAGVRPTSGLNISCIYNMYWNLPFCSLTCLMKIYYGRFMDNVHSLFHPLPSNSSWVQTSCPVRPKVHQAARVALSQH